MNQKLLKAEEVAERLNISVPMVYLMMRRGDFPVVTIGRLKRMRQEDIDKFVIDQTRINNPNPSLERRIGENHVKPHPRDFNHE